jgi:hypothetical protein
MNEADRRPACEHRSLIAHQTLNLIPPFLHRPFSEWLSDLERRSLLSIYTAGPEGRQMLVDFFLEEHKRSILKSIATKLNQTARTWTSGLPANHWMRLDRRFLELADRYTSGAVAITRARSWEAQRHLFLAHEQWQRFMAIWRDSFDADYVDQDASVECARAACIGYNHCVLAAATVLGRNVVRLERELFDERAFDSETTRFLKASERGVDFFSDLQTLLQDVVKLLWLTNDATRTASFLCGRQ